MTDLQHILKTLEYEEKEKKKVTKTVGTIQRLMTIKVKTLEEELGGVLANELNEVKKWYREFKKDESAQENSIPLKEAFTVETWDKRIIENSSEENSYLQNITEPLK